MYSVKYRTSGQWFFRKIKNIKGDGLMPDSGNRFFILMDETRIEIPCASEIVFNKDRFIFIKKEMEKESGVDIKV